MTDHAAIFSRLYTASSGAGSSKEFTAPYREYLSSFINRNRIHSIVDLGCGDMTVMSNLTLDHGVRYLGVDVIAYRIEENARLFPRCGFSQCAIQYADLRTFVVPPCGLLVCKDVLQHWTNVEVNRFLARLLAMPFRHALLVNCNYGPKSGVNVDIDTGGWRPLDLQASPFFLKSGLAFRWGDAYAGYKDVIHVSKAVHQ